ncbi:MAG: type II toxin-antitoxin system RelE/ParE family toxin [Xanthobacteraceae bacterium]|nr:type II toxin-antitoxin system RelE/ParE family toxin [Xanthobacteraceae bacterium]
MKVVVSDRADADLVRIYRHLSGQSPAAADSLLKEIARKFRNLSDFPFIGRDRSMLSSGIRSIVAHPYVIFYQVEPASVVIVRVLHGRRDIDAEFQR